MQLISQVAILALFTVPIFSHPVIKARDAVNDTDILNFALTLEHLENAFYSGALAKFDQAAFLAAGLPGFARARFEEIAAHEKTHVKFLTNALGDKATKPCKYKFPYTDPKSFAALSQIFEGVGTSAYAGATKLIQNKDTLTSAAVILSTEARQASWVASAVNKQDGWSGAFDTPLDMNEAFTLATPFIVSCPPTNPVLPVKPFPALNILESNPKPNSVISVSFNSTTPNKATFAVFFNGLLKEIVPVKGGKVTIPGDLREQIYVVLSTSDTTVDDSTIVAGPAVLTFPTNPKGQVF